MLLLKRIYEPYNPKDGYRILVDRLWPRGISKEKAHLNEWLKDIAPSTQLRLWFHHDSTKWNEFQKKYKDELSQKKELLNLLRALEEKHKTITLLFGAKDITHNEATVLLDVLT